MAEKLIWLFLNRRKPTEYRLDDTLLFICQIKVCPVGVADRVNLGLIPSSEAGWSVACAALKPSSGGILHIHGNVTSFRSHGSEEKSDRLSHGASNDEECAREKFSLDNNQRVMQAVNASTGDVINRSEFEVKIQKTSHDDKRDNQENTAECNGESYFQGKNTKHYLNWKCNKNKLKPAWIEWVGKVTDSLHSILLNLCDKEWECCVLHVENVKSYAPHIDHIVADVQCKPSDTNFTS